MTHEWTRVHNHPLTTETEVCVAHGGLIGWRGVRWTPSGPELYGPVFADARVVRAELESDDPYYSPTVLSFSHPAYDQ